MRVIIADDSGIVRGVLVGMVKRLGHEVVATPATGPAAVLACAEHRPDAVMLDVSMPGEISGAEAAKAIRAAGTSAAIVLCTSMNSSYTADVAKSVKAFRLLKPVHNQIQVEQALAKAVELGTL